MTKSKLSAQDIIDIIAQKAEVTKSSADEFFRTLLAVVEEGLLSDEVVKLKEFGTFKLTWNAPRKSVNVQTGEDFVIDGYYKVTFVPEKKLKDSVNEPFAYLEPFVLDAEPAESRPDEEINPLAALSEQADEIKGLLSEIQSMSRTNVSQQPADELQAEEPLPLPADEPFAAEETVPSSDSAPESSDEPRPVAVPLPASRPRRSVFLRVSMAAVAFVAAFVALYFACMPVQHWVNKVFFGYDTATYDAVHERSVAIAEQSEVNTRPCVQPVSPDTFQMVFENRFENREYLGTERLNQGSRLAHLADRYYNSPYFWVYIYEANMETIPDPDRVREGAVVRIPKMHPLLVDPDNPRAMEAALQLREKYLKK